LLTSVRDIRDSYARTLRTWRESFFAHEAEVRDMGFDDRFIRMWDYYLSISEAGFRTGMTQDLQIGFEKSRGRP
jgi:cyclopropane-fatty-acyl-phospholipid synthase